MRRHSLILSDPVWIVATICQQHLSDDAVAEFIVHDSKLQFRGSNHVLPDAINSKRGVLEFPAHRTCRGQTKATRMTRRRHSAVWIGTYGGLTGILVGGRERPPDSRSRATSKRRSADLGTALAAAQQSQELGQRLVRRFRTL